MLARRRTVCTRRESEVRQITLRKIELNITFQCNLKCPGCNRLCNITELDKPMEVKQVRLLIEKLREENVKLIRTKVVGGEPTLHRNFLEICRVLGENTDIAGKVSVNTNGTMMHMFQSLPS